MANLAGMYNSVSLYNDYLSFGFSGYNDGISRFVSRVAESI